MANTARTFIQRLQGGGDETWRQLDQLYRPLIVHWLRGFTLRTADIDDLVQEILMVVMLRINDFDHNGRVGAFRRWLRVIAANTTRSYLRKAKRQQQSPETMKLLEELEDTASPVAQQFDRDHDDFVLRELLSRVEAEFEPKTMAAFRMHVLDQVDARDTAQRLEMSPRAVYIAKSRVLRRLREEAADWFDELTPA